MDVNSKEYLEENIDCCKRNFEGRHCINLPERYVIINHFSLGARSILSVGSGGHEPLKIHATHACDIAPNAEGFLRSLGWGGEFKCCSCTDLPYPTKSFDVAVCSEVIEHLPTEQDIMKTFEELDRVANKWIVTTIAAPRGKFNPEITHKHDFTFEKLVGMLSKFKVYIYQKENFFYVEKA